MADLMGSNGGSNHTEALDLEFKDMDSSLLVFQQNLLPMYCWLINLFELQFSLINLAYQINFISQSSWEEQMK